MIPGIVASSGGGIDATGGTVVTSGSYKYHTFTSSGTFTINSGLGDLEILLIGGGGGGGAAFNGFGNAIIRYGGGGGAGGVTNPTISGAGPGSYTIGIGNAGSGGSLSAGGTGTASTIIQSAITLYTASGGGAGGYNNNGGGGASGGGGSLAFDSGV